MRTMCQFWKYLGDGFISTPPLSPGWFDGDGDGDGV